MHHKARTYKSLSLDAKHFKMQFARRYALAVISPIYCDGDKSLLAVMPRSLQCVLHYIVGNSESATTYP